MRKILKKAISFLKEDVVLTIVSALVITAIVITFVLATKTSQMPSV